MLLEAPSPVTLRQENGSCSILPLNLERPRPNWIGRGPSSTIAVFHHISRGNQQFTQPPPPQPVLEPDRMTDATPFAPQSHYDKAELIACGLGELFGAGNAQLPVENMLMVDRISHISSEGGAVGKGELIAELDIYPDLWFFACHFPGDPVMPGCLGLDAMWQLVGFFLGWRGNPGRGRALGCGEVKFTGQILPDHRQVRYHIHMKRVIERKLVMGIADGSVAVDGEVIYTASDLRVGLFQSTDSM